MKNVSHSEMNQRENKSEVGPCCGVHAVAVATGISFDECFELFKKTFNRSSRWKGRTSHSQRLQILKDLEIDFQVCRISRCSLLNFVKKSRKRDLYIVTTGSHVQVVHNGEVEDQHERKPVEDFHWNRNIVKNAIRIKSR